MVRNLRTELPSSDDIKEQILFSPDSGYIWLDEQRMILMHSEVMSSLRKELIETLGLERAKGVLMRMGFKAGERDAELAKKLRKNCTDIEKFFVGPQLHQLEGFVGVREVKLEVDVAKRQFYMENDWEGSFEGETYIKDFGFSEDPVCWMQIGYASGYTSGFVGRSIIFKEVRCLACHDSVCSIVGKPVDEWEDAEELIKHFRPDSVVDQILDLQEQVYSLRSNLDEAFPAQKDIIGSSPQFLHAYQLLAKAASGPVTVLLLGETGVGKEVFARSLHKMSQRDQEPFIAVNCAAIPDDLVEAELFGVEKGAYTGAHVSRPGRFERANGGTLFLDEIGDLSLSAQAKLLRVLQEGELERVGGTEVIKVDVRLVAATNVNLQDRVESADFRKDLYYRLNIYPVMIPALRERIDDIPLLVKFFIDKFAVRHEKQVKGVTDRAMRALQNYCWPGNIRELENIIERGVIMCDNGNRIDFQQMFALINVDCFNEGEKSSLKEDGCLGKPCNETGSMMIDSFFEAQHSLIDLESKLLKEAVGRAEGNLAAAARMLGITRPQLAYRLKKQDK